MKHRSLGRQKVFDWFQKETTEWSKPSTLPKHSYEGLKLPTEPNGRYATIRLHFLWFTSPCSTWVARQSTSRAGLAQLMPGWLDLDAKQCQPQQISSPFQTNRQLGGLLLMDLDGFDSSSHTDVIRVTGASVSNRVGRGRWSLLATKHSKTHHTRSRSRRSSASFEMHNFSTAWFFNSNFFFLHDTFRHLLLKYNK